MDLLKDRLAHILRAKNLTATQFAELMQIQPSNVSHLLSGRNKPSFDFLIKLKEVFPEYSYEWIISGKKPITISETVSHQNNTLFESIDESKKDDNDVVDINNSAHLGKISPLDVSEIKLQTVDSSKGLKQIIYVYEDRTFEVYNIRE